VPPGDEAVGAHEDRAVALDLAVAKPGAARVVEIAVELTDPERTEREARLPGELAGRLAPRLAVLAGDQQETSRLDQILDRAAVAVLVVDPGVRQRRARACGRGVDADVVDRLRGRAAVGDHGRGRIRVAVLDVQLRELHRLRADLAEYVRAVLGVFGPPAPHPAQLRHALLRRLLGRNAERGADSTGLPNGSGPGAGSSPPHAFESGAAESRKMRDDKSPECR
jgi:hypothetical protein